MFFAKRQGLRKMRGFGIAKDDMKTAAAVVSDCLGVEAPLHTDSSLHQLLSLFAVKEPGFFGVMEREGKRTSRRG